MDDLSQAQEQLGSALDRARQGDLEDADMRRLTIAVRNDPEAALEHQLFTAFDSERAPAPDDDDIIAVAFSRLPGHALSSHLPGKWLV